MKKNKIKGVFTPPKSKQKTNPEDEIEVSPETRVFFALLQFFRLRLEKCKSLKGFHPETVNRIADSVFKETITGFDLPEIPAEFRKAEKAIREEMDKAKADVFNLEYMQGLYIVPKGEDKNFVETGLQIRKELEQSPQIREGVKRKYREENGHYLFKASLEEVCCKPHKQGA